jgi:hypothetical protein
MTPADVLEKAAGFLEVTGWTQRISHEVNGNNEVIGACLNGACWLAAAGLTDREIITADDVSSIDINFVSFSPFQKTALNAAWNAIMETHVDPIGWNDEPERTLGEVVDLLRETAKDFHNQAQPEELS